MRITETALKRPILVTAIFLILVSFGVVGLSRLPIDIMPDISLPAVVVATVYPGAGPEEVEGAVTEPLERQLATLANLKELHSFSQENFSLILLRFGWGTDVDLAASDVREKLDLAQIQLPSEAERPILLKFDVTMIPVMVLGLKGKLGMLEEEWLVDQVAQTLQRLPGVASVSRLGGAEREIQVRLDNFRLQSLGITPEVVVGALKAHNLNLPLGELQSGHREYRLRMLSQFSSVNELYSTVVGQKGGVPIYLRDVATVVDTLKERSAIVRSGGEELLIFQIQKKARANTVGVSNQVKSELIRINQQLPPGTELTVLFDTAQFTRASINSLIQVLLLGILLTILVLFAFLRNLRATLIAAVSIPISVLITFLLMYWAGYTLNLISLGGVALAVGMVVDNAIVVLDNIFRHRQKGERPYEAGLFGTGEVGGAIIASTLTTLAIFLPLVLVRGLMSIVFGELAFTVAFALGTSLLVALTLVPLLTHRFLKVEPRHGKVYLWAERTYNKLENGYTRTVGWALRHKLGVGLGTLGIFAVSILLIRTVGSEFIPPVDLGETTINCEMPVGTNLQTTDRAVAKVEEIILKSVPELEVMQTIVGTGERITSGIGRDVGGAAGPHTASIRVRLLPKTQRRRSTTRIEDDLRRSLVGIPGLVVRVGENPLEEQLAGRQIKLEIRGYDLAQLARAADEVEVAIARVPGIRDIESSLEAGAPEYRIVVDRSKAGIFGLAPYQIGSALRTKLSGVVATQYKEGGKEYEVLVRLKPSDRAGLSQLSSITVTSPLGEIPLTNFARLEAAKGPTQIERREQQRVVELSGRVVGRDLGSVSRDVQQALKEVALPPGVAVEQLGAFQQMAESFRDLMFMLLIAIVLVFLVMAAQFESLLNPFIIMFTVPLAFIGVAWMLFFTATPLSIFAYAGLIMLAGIVVNNGIVYITYTNILRGRGYELTRAVVEAGRTRLRPILMTAFTTIFALIPMALALGEGAELRFPMARAVIGGLLVSTLLTLIFIPVLYTAIEGYKERRRQ